MIKITPDFPCIHCGACAKACSHGVIKMVPNEEGKLIPRVSLDRKSTRLNSSHIL